MSRTDGMTMVEVLAAMAVVALVGGGMMSAHLYGHRQSEQSRNHGIAARHANSLMEDIQATSFAGLASRFPGGVANGPAGFSYAQTIGGYTLDGEQIIVTYPAIVPGRQELLVTVNWTEWGSPRTLRLSTVRTTDS